MDFYNHAMTVSGAIWGAVGAQRQRANAPAPPTPPPLLQIRNGRAESPAWYMIQAIEFHPEPLTVEKLRVRDTYASERIAFSLLELLASEGWLDRINETEYALTKLGRETIDNIRNRMRTALSELTLSTDIDRLESLLRRIIDESLNAPTPPGSWCLHYSRRRAPADDAPTLAKIQQYFGDFNAFRDDAHMAGWQPLGVAGYVWESFSFVCDDQANTADALFEQLNYRGYSKTEFAGALSELADKGWIETSGDVFEVTETGRAVRTQVEADTDSYFYASWSALSEDERAELTALMTALHEELQEIAAG